MPARIIEGAADWRTLRGDALTGRLNTTADRLEVTATALLWRLVSLGFIERAEARAIPAATLRFNGRPNRPQGEVRPTLFSKRFVEIVARAVDEGRVSTRKIASLLGLSIDDLGDLFAAYGVPAPYNL
jgi:hypothetical protein